MTEILSPVLLVVKERKNRVTYSVRLEHENGLVVLEKTRLPFFAGCRELIKRGFDPDTPVAFRHAGSATISMRSTIGRAASKTVSEPDVGVMTIQPYVEFKGRLN